MLANVGALAPDNIKVKYKSWNFFDRIINLKFGFKSDITDTSIPTSYYVLRSDYEILENGVVRRCKYKPSIRISYQQIPAGNVLKLMVEIDNFYMISSDNKIIRDFSISGYKINSLDIQVGYGAAFYKDIPPTPAELFAFNTPSGADTIHCTIQAVYPQNNPPNYTLVIDCLIGTNTIAQPFVTKDITQGKLKLIQSNPNYIYAKDGSVEAILFQSITRRFLSKPITSYDIVTQALINADLKMNGILSAPLAAQVGVKCSFWNGGVQIVKSKVARGMGSEVAKKMTSKGIRISNDMLITQQNRSIGGVLNNLNNLLGTYFYYIPLLDGSIVVYNTFPENQPQTEAYIKQYYGELSTAITPFNAQLAITKEFKNELPAVYSMTAGVSPVIIRCPFFYWINPMSKIVFNYPYATGNLLSFLTGTTEQNSAVIISQQVEFATNDDTNMMTLSCIAGNKGA